MKLCDLNLSRSNVHLASTRPSLMLETQQIIIITIVLSVSDSWRGWDHYRTTASFLRPPPPPNLWASATWPLALVLHTVDQGTHCLHCVSCIYSV